MPLKCTPMITLLSRLIAILPLKTTHTLGACLGWIIHQMTPATAKLRRDNLRQSGLSTSEAELAHTLKQNISETGKSLLESLAIWQWPQARALSYIQGCTGWPLVEQALQTGKGLIFITPHLGCFEITSIYYAARHPITVLYRPPKKTWLSPLMQSGRQKGMVDLAPASAAGVRKLLQALKRGEAVGILPDQIPKRGEGEWAPFFGKPAYTMGLASKLAVKSGATVIMAFGERLPGGSGYHIHLHQVADISTPERLNAAIEQQIAQCPSQYLWQYDRYKQRRYALRKLQKDSTETESPD